jgi:Domain of unknown function (DUF1707)
MNQPALRIGDADRERTAERLRRAAGEGRLAPEELEVRLEAAFSARTAGELRPLVADLPPEPPPRPRPRSRRAAGGERRVWVATSILLVAIWALTGAGYFWPVWPILGWGLFVLGPLLPSPLRDTLPQCRRNASSTLSTSR